MAGAAVARVALVRNVPLSHLLLALLLLLAGQPTCCGRCQLDVRLGDRSSCDSGAPGAGVRAAVLLPFNASRFEVALPRVLPAMELAAKEVASRGLLPGNFTFLQADDKCDAVYGQISAVEMYAHYCAHVFFGPTCEYSAAPVGRMVKFWNTPLITVGALTHDFSNNKTSCDHEFHMLTRVSTLSFRDLAMFLVAIMEHYTWKKAMLVYDKNGYENLSGEHTCKLMMETLVKYLKEEKLLFGSFDTEKAANQGVKEHLRAEVGYDYGGEWTHHYSIEQAVAQVLYLCDPL